MGRPRHRILQDRGLRGEEPGDKVAVLAGGSDDHTTCAQVGPVEERAVDVELFDVLLAGINQHVVPGQVHLEGRLVQGFGQRRRKLGGVGRPVGQGHVESVC